MQAAGRTVFFLGGSATIMSTGTPQIFYISLAKLWSSPFSIHGRMTIKPTIPPEFNRMFDWMQAVPLFHGCPIKDQSNKWLPIQHTLHGNKRPWWRNCIYHLQVNDNLGPLRWGSSCCDACIIWKSERKRQKPNHRKPTHKSSISVATRLYYHF